jgi:hypothetical protein
LLETLFVAENYRAADDLKAARAGHDMSVWNGVAAKEVDRLLGDLDQFMAVSHAKEWRCGRLPSGKPRIRQGKQDPTAHPRNDTVVSITDYERGAHAVEQMSNRGRLAFFAAAGLGRGLTTVPGPIFRCSTR